VAPIGKSMTPNSGGFTQPGSAQPGYGAQAPNRGGFFSGLGGGIVGGMLGGLFFSGLFGSMTGAGFGGVGGGLSSIFQLLLIGGLVWLAFRWFRNRQPAAPQAFGRPSPFSGNASPYQGNGGGFGGGAASPNPANRDEIGISNRDLEGFEAQLGQIQDAYAREDHQGLRRLTTPEMVSYLSEELADNATHGLRNEVKDLKFLNGDVSEAWREGNRDYATVAMQWQAVDIFVDRASGEVKKGDPDHPVETTELWTFMRENGGAWLLSAIQDARG
jgi:predicted lipid-binding transport protein (Tim44 family)